MTVLRHQHVHVYTTAKYTRDRLTLTAVLPFRELQEQPSETDVCVFVDASKCFQTLVGIGGAITDAVAQTLAKMPLDKQQTLMRAYFDPQEGIGYTMARTSIHSCDFSPYSYTSVAENDVSLNSFSIAHDQQYRIPCLKQAMQLAGSLKLLVSPWSPPAWMKSNGSMLNGGRLLPQYRQQWADYITQFIHAYEKAGVPIWGLTVQNEPMASQTWESCLFTAQEECDFIKHYLGKTLHQQGLSEKKIIAWDHNRDLIYQRASIILSDVDAARYVWGIGYHWYETWTGSAMRFDNLKRVKEAFPQTELIFTEGCIEKFDRQRLDDWSLGERYAYSMIHDFNAGANAWLDWNLFLDETGGPNHVGNVCFAPIIADTHSGDVHYTNSYYYLGHFSKFAKPQAQRIISSSNRDSLQTTAFLNTDGRVAVIVLNTTETEIDYHLWADGHSVALKSLPHSMMTLLY